MRKVPLGVIDSQDGMNTGSDVRGAVEAIVKEHCEGYSGADLAALVREAGVMALKRTLGALESLDQAASSGENVSVHVGMEDFTKALDKVQPSVSVSQRRKYESLRSKFSGLPVKAGLPSKEIDGKDKDSPVVG